MIPRGTKLQIRIDEDFADNFGVFIDILENTVFDWLSLSEKNLTIGVLAEALAGIILILSGKKFPCINKKKGHCKAAFFYSLI